MEITEALIAIYSLPNNPAGFRASSLETRIPTHGVSFFKQAGNDYIAVVHDSTKGINWQAALDQLDTAAAYAINGNLVSKEVMRENMLQKNPGDNIITTAPRAKTAEVSYRYFTDLNRSDITHVYLFSNFDNSIQLKYICSIDIANIIERRAYIRGHYTGSALRLALDKHYPSVISTLILEYLL